MKTFLRFIGIISSSVIIYLGVLTLFDTSSNNPSYDETNKIERYTLLETVENLISPPALAATYPSKWTTWKKASTSKKMQKAGESTVRGAITTVITTFILKKRVSQDAFKAALVGALTPSIYDYVKTGSKNVYYTSKIELRQTKKAPPVIIDSKKYFETRVTVTAYKDKAHKKKIKSTTKVQKGHPGLLYGF